MNSSFDMLTKDLKELGIKRGDTVIVHSSLSSMGEVKGGAETVISALLYILGDEGTLLFPAFSYSSVYETHRFSYADTPVCVGKIPETFRHMEGVIRSIHPTHSVAAIGRLARSLTEGHENDRTPMGVNSPYRKLADADALILMLGCSLSSVSYMHALEEEAGVEYCLTPYEVEYTVDLPHRSYTDKYRKHNFRRKNFRITQEYTRCVDVLEKDVDYFQGKVHGANSYLIKCKNLREKALSVMSESPYYFVGLPEGYVPGTE
jgi:aminoglycoside 3-N-acetyltransferase